MYNNQQIKKMKTGKIFIAVSLFGLVLTSCQQEKEIVIPETVTPTTLVDFEGVKLNSSGYWDGSDLTGDFVSVNSTFKNSYNSAWASWTGFVCSSNTDTLTSGYNNQYSVATSSGALKSKQFAIAYDSAAFVCPANTYGNFNIKSLYITNSTYAYLGLKNGDYGTGGIGKKFTTGDWFKVTLKGYKSNVLTSSIDIYLADFRNGKSIILKSWTKVDVSALGQVDLVTFTFDSTDKSGIWLNTPAYACIDNIEFTQSISTK